MDRACENCRFCVYAHSMRGKEEKYCERHSKYIGDTLLCSKWEKVSVPKPRTDADRIRGMSDEELAKWLDLLVNRAKIYGENKVWLEDTPRYYTDWLDWLKEEASE